MKGISFDGGYGRTGRIYAEEAKCSICLEQQTCIVIDQSEGEYNAGCVCERCTSMLFHPKLRQQEQALQKLVRISEDLGLYEQESARGLRGE